MICRNQTQLELKTRQQALRIWAWDMAGWIDMSSGSSDNSVVEVRSITCRPAAQSPAYSGAAAGNFSHLLPSSSFFSYPAVYISIFSHELSHETFIGRFPPV